MHDGSGPHSGPGIESFQGPTGGGRTLLRIATRFNWRVAAAMLGIAACATYASGAVVLLDGLDAGSQSVLGRLDTGPYLAYLGVFPELEPFVIGETLQGPRRAGWLRTADLITEASPIPVRVLGLAEGDALGGPTPAPGTTFVSAPLSRLSGADPVVLRTEVGVVEVRVARSGSPSPLLPETWIVISETDLRQIATWEDGHYDLLFVAEREDALQLEKEGYSVLALASTADFFGAALQEARRLVGSLVAVSAVAIAVVAFSLLSLELRYRRGEIQTLRALGLDGWGLVRLYGLQLAFVVAGGAVLGVAGGIAAAHGLVSFAPLLGLPTVITPHLSLGGLLVPLGASLGAGLAGGGIGLVREMRRWDHAPRR